MVDESAIPVSEWPCVRSPIIYLCDVVRCNTRMAFCCLSTFSFPPNDDDDDDDAASCAYTSRRRRRPTDRPTNDTPPNKRTNREAALSDLGRGQVAAACGHLLGSSSASDRADADAGSSRAAGATPTVVRYSLAASSADTADIVGKELGIGRDRLVPEFNYMDPR